MSYNLHTHRAPSHVLDRSEAGPGVRPPCIRPGSGDVGPPSSREKKIINSRWNMHSLTSACCHLSRNSEKNEVILIYQAFISFWTCWIKNEKILRLRMHITRTVWTAVVESELTSLNGRPSYLLDII